MKLLAFSIIFVLTATALADPTTNVVSPIADTLGHREGWLSHTLSGSDRFDRPYGHYSVLTVGIKDRLEIGGATDYLGSHSWSLKGLLWDQKGTALALGAMGIRNGTANPYAVGRVDFGRFRLHGGLGRFDEIKTGMLGFDYDVPGLLKLQADHTSGPDGATWFAISREWSGGFFTQLAVERPNRPSDSWGHFAYVGYGFKF